MSGNNETTGRCYLVRSARGKTVDADEEIEWASATEYNGNRFTVVCFKNPMTWAAAREVLEGKGNLFPLRFAPERSLDEMHAKWQVAMLARAHERAQKQKNTTKFPIQKAYRAVSPPTAGKKGPSPPAPPASDSE